ncbi:uncharacterized protein K02A2.6-like [Anastrepha ludens]|uniref:uncharacterized protein K02A2.6-like n=1 Tax=Anastrepha ludens TaxID=28586 RepID=UPI0023B00942|nr:uncharacterized protein K02A2.6-like [Anastrepha ludens]
MIGVMPEFEPLKSSTSPTQFLIRAEQLQKCHGWKEQMMLIAVQHQMKSMAKRWLDAQPVFQSWSQYVNAFKIDFPSTHNAAEAYKMLMGRKRKNGEDYVEYYYSMLTIGRQGLVDDVSINTHIISGLNDGALTKALAAMSFGTCSQLLLALKNLTFTSSISTTSTTPTQQILKSETKSNAKQTQVKCFNLMQKKVRCTECTKIGHEAKNCNKKPAVVEIGNHNESDEAPPVMKVVELNGKEFEAFIDTGSVCSLIRESATDGMQILGTNKCFTVFGGSKVQVTRQVNVVANVDNVQREITLYIVADSLLPYDILLGRDVLQNNGYYMVVDKGVLHLNEIKINNFNISSDLSQEDKSKVRNLLVDKQNCFAEDISGIGRCKSAQMSIEVTKSGPILGKIYQVPFSQRPELSRILAELLDNDIISPSSSPHAASVLLVKKSNGENRMCIDYRALNEVTVKKNYVMPIVEEQLSRLSGNKYFSTLDMTSGYYQVPMNENSKKYTAFLTHEGLFEHNVMPFGLVNAPMVFQEIVVNLIKSLKHRDKVVSYVDEVIIATKTVDEGIMVLKEFLEATGLTLRPSKEFCINKVTGGKKEAQLHVSKVVPIPFRYVHIDHLGPFVRSQHVIRALRNTKTTPVLAALRDYMTIYGCPTQMVSDRGTAFTSKEFQNFVERYYIRHTKVGVLTPRANGQAERINKTILHHLNAV